MSLVSLSSSITAQTMAVDAQLPTEAKGRVRMRAMYGQVRVSQVNFEDKSTDVASIVVGGVE